MRGLMPTAARMMVIVRARHAASDRSAGPPTGRSVVAPFSMVRCRTKRRREQRRILIGPTWARRRQSRGSQIELLPLLLHPDLGALRTFPLPLLVVDVALDLLHRDLALSTCHSYSSIAPKAYVEARESRQACRKPQPRQRAGLLWLRGTSLITSADFSSATASRSLPRSWSSKGISTDQSNVLSVGPRSDLEECATHETS